MKTRTRPPATPSHQRGVALVVAVVILIGISVVSLSSLKTSVFELLMAGNDEARTSAFQHAHAGLDAVAVETTNFVVTGGLGYRNCTASFEPSSDCNQMDITVPDAFDATNTQMYVERLAPLATCPPRGMETSCENFTVAIFAMDSHYNDTANRGGRSRQQEGYLILVPRLDQGRQ